MVFGNDIILTTPVIAYWKNIRQRKQKIIDKNNQNKKLKLQTAQIYSTWESTIVR